MSETPKNEPSLASTPCSRQEIPREKRTNAPAAVFERLPDLLAGKADPESKEENLHPVTAYCKAYNMGIITSKEMHELAAKWERDHSSANAEDVGS
jgi:hypothetical protein